jgi:hypothetical protein
MKNTLWIYGTTDTRIELQSSYEFLRKRGQKYKTSRQPKYRLNKPVICHFCWGYPTQVTDFHSIALDCQFVNKNNIIQCGAPTNYPALNVYHHQEDMACDIVYSEVPAISDGSTAAFITVGVTTQIMDVYYIKHDRQLVNMLEDNIIPFGALHKLISDSNLCASF